MLLCLQHLPHSEKLEQCGLKAVFIKTFKFITHFVVVMLLLYCGAMVFARLEDPNIMYAHEGYYTTNNNTNNNTYNVNNTETQGEGMIDLDEEIFRNLSTFWVHMESKHNVSMGGLRNSLLHDMHTFVRELSEQPRRQPQQLHDPHHNETHELTLDEKQHFIFMKWFYFVVIATTTIGYGDVSPQTPYGRLFYIFFSIVGIAMMMTLLRYVVFGEAIQNIEKSPLHSFFRFFLLRIIFLLSGMC